jgi:hypothetical protein
VSSLAEPLPKGRWPALLAALDRPSADPNWLAGAVRAPEPLVEAVPKLAGGVVASEAESDVTPIAATRNLIPTEQAPGDRVLTLTRGG